MNATIRRSKMVSFRLSFEEYRRFQDICTARRVRSISELARTAMQKFLTSEDHLDPLTYEVSDLREQVRSISRELERVSRLVDTRKIEGA